MEGHGRALLQDGYFLLSDSLNANPSTNVGVVLFSLILPAMVMLLSDRKLYTESAHHGLGCRINWILPRRRKSVVSTLVRNVIHDNIEALSYGQ